jgi:hypothetical protein
MTDIDLRAAQAVRDQLLTAWSMLHADPRPVRITYQASLDAIEEKPPPPPGLAVGYMAEESGRVRVGVRTTASGKGLKAARDLVAKVEKQGVPVDFRIIPQPVIAPSVGQLDAGAGLAHFTGHFRPLLLGSSISHENGPAGTLGAFVRVTDQIGVLSCSHVLALGGDARVGDIVYQPAQNDQELVVGENRIGKLSGKFAPLIAGKPNNLDAAVAILDDPRIIALGNCIPCADLPGGAIPAALQGKALGAVRSVTAVPRLTKVAKIGRSSGYTEGILVLSALTNFTPDLFRKGKREKYAFPDVIEVQSLSTKTPFAIPGDSGALVFTLPDMIPIGLHFCSLPLASEPSLNYLMPLERICAMFALEVL